MLDTSRAAYRVLDAAGFYSDNDHLYVEGDEIYFDGEPNDQLEPLNELARTRLVEYLDKQDKQAKAVAEKLNRPYVSRPRNLEGAVEIATALQKQNISIMGAKDKQVTTEKIEQSVPETGTANPKRGRGRPRKVA